MKKILFTLLLFIPICIFAQERKMYKGKYELDGRWGTVEYEYIETSNGRVFDGQFNFKEHPLTTTRHFEKISLRGRFAKGLKDGLWIRKIDVSHSSMQDETKNFKNGKLNGVLESGGVRFVYKDNHFAGTFGFRGCTGQFDENGYADGKWVEKISKGRSGIPYTKTQVWKNGYLLSDIEIDESTGSQIDRMIEWEKERCYREGKLIKQNDGILYYEAEINPHKIEGIISSFFFGEKGNNKTKLGNGLHIGEYTMTIFPFKGIRRPLTKEEIIRIEKQKAEIEQKEREAKEKAENERREKEEKEKRIQEEIALFDNSLYGKLLSEIRSNMNKGKNLGELKQEFIPSKFKTSPIISYNANFPKLRIIKIPIKYGIFKNSAWTEIKHILIFDNTGKKWTDNIVNGIVNCNYGSMVNFESPCVFFESQHFALGINDKKEIFIVQKKDGKFKKSEIVKEISGNETKLNKGFFYMIKSDEGGVIDPMSRITVDELNKTTRSRVMEKMK